MKKSMRASRSRLTLILLALGVFTAALAAPGAAIAAGGDILWSVPLSGIHSDGALAVAPGPSGSALLSGWLTPGGTTNVLAMKENEGGTPDWLLAWGGTLDGGAQPTASAYDPRRQSLYLVAGIDDPVHQYAAAVIKVDAAGAVAWTRTWSGRDESVPVIRQAAVDARGNLYLAGSVSYEEGGLSEAVLVKYSQQGVEQWESTWWYGVGDLSVSGLVVSRSGAATCVGSRYAPDMTAHSFVRTVGATGRTLWKRAFGGRSKDQLASAVATAPRGCVVAAGSRRTAGVNLGVAEKYSARGRLLWRRTVSTGSSGDGFLDVAVRRDGTVFASGATAIDVAGPCVVALRPSGRVLWNAQWAHEGWGQQIVVTRSRVYVGGALARESVDGPQTIGVECLKAGDGSVEWQRSYDLGAGVDDAGVLDMAVVAGRSVFVAIGLHNAARQHDGRFLRLAP